MASYPAGWAVTDSAVWDDSSSSYKDINDPSLVSGDYSSSYTDIRDPSWDWTLTVWRSSIAFLEQYELEPVDRRSSADARLYSEAFEREEGAPYPVFLRGEDVIIKGYTGYLMEYLKVADGGWAAWVAVLFLDAGADSFEVTLEGPPARMLASYSEMRDIILR